MAAWPATLNGRAGYFLSRHCTVAVTRGARSANASKTCPQGPTSLQDVPPERSLYDLHPSPVVPPLLTMRS